MNMSDLEYESVEQAANELLVHISEFIGVNTVYIAKKEEDYMQVMDAYNKGEQIVDSDLQVDYDSSYCQYVISSDDAHFKTFNLSEDEATSHMKLAEELGAKAFMGVKLYDKDNQEFGTLCVLDTEAKEFSNQEISFLQSIGKMFNFIINLDQTQQQVDLLSTPIVPVTEGVAVLPIVGYMSEDRSSQLLGNILRQVQQNELDYFILDLSGLVTFNNLFINHLMNIIDSLELMGVKAVITGIRPDMAMAQVKQGAKFKNIIIASSLEQALQRIGFTLIKNEAQR
ncbi:STAS domain-containing protein [Halobacillus sp. A5]|uniref:STAS domain-containing protein n=1 Tax=Halobacillus sp. A5 TaxID=2880263 RepID=UPI0020A67CC4|nr:STAS domain-containing protein [Halobacillus sp. A5]MCP3029405.1 STAS domain-containing protein [Halobacillus sp. A5]